VLGPGAIARVAAPDEPAPAPTKTVAPPPKAAAAQQLNPRLTFDQFVIGESNRLAHAAALAVAETPGLAYNPLFICGPPGLGKTHLLHSIANYVHEHGGGMTARYTTAEAFTDHFVAAIQGGDMDGNPKTEADPTWFPLISTPAFPAYASAHATLSGSARAVLERIFGVPGHVITLTNSALPGIVLDYTTFSQVCDDIDDARIYGGIHFRFDQEAGALQGRKVGNYIVTHHLR
jgi:hypothetical protein